MNRENGAARHLFPSRAGVPCVKDLYIWAKKSSAMHAGQSNPLIIWKICVGSAPWIVMCTRATVLVVRGDQSRPFFTNNKSWRGLSYLGRSSLTKVIRAVYELPRYRNILSSHLTLNRRCVISSPSKYTLLPPGNHKSTTDRTFKTHQI